MKINNTKDVGLHYIKKLGIKPERSAQKIFDKLSQEFGAIEADAYMDSLYDMTDKNKKLFYKLKNSDYQKSMIFSGAYDADIIRKACNWIECHKECFGETILEVGCDCGFMTPFLATSFPNARIVAVDRNDKAIDIARRNLKKFEVNNVEFFTGDIKLLKGKKFETVFSMRTVQENRKRRYIEHFHDDWKITSDEFMQVINDYAMLLDTLTAENGTLVSIERMEVDPLFLAWLKSLNRNGFRTDVEDIEQLHVYELDDTHDFPAIIAKRGEPVSDHELEQKWLEMLGYNPDKKQWKNWEALAAANDLSDKLIEGSYVLNEENECVGKMAYFSVKDDPDSLLFLINAGTEKDCTLQLLPKDEESTIREELFRILEHNRNLGFTIKKINE